MTGFPHPTLRLSIPVMLATLCATALSGCGGGEPTRSVLAGAETSCGAGLARIRVDDGFLQILCGCQETDGLISAAGEMLTCTVSSGTTVAFMSVGARFSHRIVSVGSPGFPSGTTMSSVENSPSSHWVRFGEPGTYLFEDSLSPGLSGTIIIP